MLLKCVKVFPDFGDNLGSVHWLCTAVFWGVSFSLLICAAMEHNKRTVMVVTALLLLFMEGGGGCCLFVWLVG